MRIYTDKQRRELDRVQCNMCGKELRVENGILKEGCFHGSQNFGYFSGRDGLVERFDLCEECYGELVRSFKIPAEREDLTEMM